MGTSFGGRQCGGLQERKGVQRKDDIRNGVCVHGGVLEFPSLSVPGADAVSVVEGEEGIKLAPSREVHYRLNGARNMCVDDVKMWLEACEAGMRVVVL